MLTGCATEWRLTHQPATDVRLHRVADVQGVCSKIVGKALLYFGCAYWNNAKSSCDIFIPDNASAAVLEHERKHCDGYDHD